ncbi:hypothetical protein FRACYDRAFT_251484 [Fragilariopsis cylindrus CCMP1102]|uniref:Uncharacterized protein n=1 Tax=Fragilariopsis cylindrus CCMP1102 TaxID=635003 RepID=A0A1E7ENS9_9STRA|nr:hypothetical protein FRACYDRAFT_251484 [Fragilariopsis cylindrus CCMP1102]|eukprot:OEU07183.1 hypothetical protein FRACYDRAFT_251484 [Fragilariopsis cylindrus CCMP1102]
MKLSFFLFVNFACGAAADQSLRGGESNTGGITSTNIRSLQIMNNSLLQPGENLDGTYVCSVRSNGSVNDATYSPETHLACVTSGESQYCANIGLSDSGGMIPGDGGGGGGPGSDDMAPPPFGGDITPDVEEVAPFDDVSEDMPDEDMPVPDGGAGPGLDDNVVIEIPRLPIEVDICDLWISKLEIKQNRRNEDEKIMMSKIRGMVQMKIIDDYTTGIDDENEFDDDGNDNEEEEGDVKNGNENDEKSVIAVDVADVAVDDDILLTKKVQILQKRVDKIMELSNDEILLFLTTIKSKSSTAITSSPSPIISSSSSIIALPVSSLLQEIPYDGTDDNEGSNNSDVDDSNDNSNDNDSDNDTTSDEEEADENECYDNYDNYNWILECKDEWHELPPIIKLNAIEIGYNSILWNQNDTSSLTVFSKKWIQLDKMQRSAVKQLGYNKHTWNNNNNNDEVGVLTTILSDDDSSDNNIDWGNTTNSDSGPDSDTDSDDSSSSSNNNNNNDDKKPSEGEDDDFMDEFVSNFLSSEEKENSTTTTTTKEKEVEIIVEEEGEDFIDEFVSNFLSGEAEKENAAATTTATTKRGEDEEGEGFIDEFVSNFLSSSEEENEHEHDDVDNHDDNDNGNTNNNNNHHNTNNETLIIPKIPKTIIER